MMVAWNLHSLLLCLLLACAAEHVGVVAMGYSVLHICQLLVKF